MRGWRTARAILCLVALGLALDPCAWAISDEEIFRDFPFNLVNPGARALGVGGAFISLADDATAAQANPAGLINLRRPELFVELRAQGYDTSSTLVSATIDTPFFMGDVAAGAESDPLRTFTPTFLSYVIPFPRVALGFSRLESLNANTRTRNLFTISGLEAQIGIDPITGDRVITGYQPIDFTLSAEADLDARVAQYNAAIALSLHRRFSIGLTAVLGTADVIGRADNLFRDNAGVLFQQPTLDYATRIDDSAADFAFNAGLLWRPADWVSIGAVYREGLRFELEQTVLDLGVRAGQAQEIAGERFTNVLHLPDSYGAGISFRPAESWTILLDLVEVQYSDLLDGYVAGLNRLSFPDSEAEFTVDDGTEVHLGLEKIFLGGKTPIALRLGAWSDPDHRIRAAAGSDLAAVFPPGSEVTHVTFGFGATLRSIQLDFAGDVSDVNSAISMSAIYRF